MTKSRRRRQLTIDQARRCTGRGGWRPGAGRPRGRTKVGHIKRPRDPERFPRHVTWRFVDGIDLGTGEGVMRIIRRAIEAGQREDSFRVIEFNVVGNHIHMMVEAMNALALARGMQGLAVRLARALNRHLGRKGQFFAERYHARTLRTPREVRIALRYILLNRRHHAAERGETLGRYWIDPCSSAAWFDGWRERIRTDAPWVRELLALRRPTVPPKTWLLRVGWRRRGLLAFDELSDADHRSTS